MGKDDSEALVRFVELVTVRQDFDTGFDFWRNIYKLWLAAYAKVIDSEFQRKIKKIIDEFNVAYEAKGLHANYRIGPVKTYERMKAQELEYCKPTHKTYEGRTQASSFLDIVRGTVMVNSPRAAVKLVNEYFRPLTQG